LNPVRRMIGVLAGWLWGCCAFDYDILYPGFLPKIHRILSNSIKEDPLLGSREDSAKKDSQVEDEAEMEGRGGRRMNNCIPGSLTFSSSCLPSSENSIFILRILLPTWRSPRYSLPPPSRILCISCLYHFII